MTTLEKILQEIEERAVCSDNEKYGFVHMKHVREIFKSHLSNNDGWIPVEDERLWDILFEEACVEGEQARRIYNRLKKTFDGERSEMNGKL